MSNLRKVLLVPPPHIGGGPSNAVMRCFSAMRKLEIETTTNVFSTWQAALLNVSINVRYDLLKLVKLNRRVVFRPDGCYVKDIFKKEGNPWLESYDIINARIKEALQKSDHVIYQSHFCKQHLDDIFIRREGTYSIVYNGIDTEVFSPVSKVLHEIPVIGCIGKFRHNRLKTIFDISKRISVPHRLLLVGGLDEKCYDDLNEFRKSKWGHRIDYISPVQGDINLARWHREIDCFVHPVLSDWCPNSVIEALSCGTPVVLPASTGGSELVCNGGIIVANPRWENYDRFVDEFAESIRNILSEWTRYSKLARERAEDIFSVNNMSSAYYSALSK